jgi:hypothetical protein
MLQSLFGTTDNCEIILAAVDNHWLHFHGISDVSTITSSF